MSGMRAQEGYAHPRRVARCFAGILDAKSICIPSDHGYSTRGRGPLFVRDTRYPGGLHQPQRSLCGVGYVRIIRFSFTITPYKPVKVDFHPANSYLYPYHETSPEQRLSSSPLVIEAGTTQGSSRFVHMFHTLFLTMTYYLYRLPDTRSRVSHQGRSRI